MNHGPPTNWKNAARIDIALRFERFSATQLARPTQIFNLHKAQATLCFGASGGQQKFSSHALLDSIFPSKTHNLIDPNRLI
jgi:hypothetical protein